MSKSKTKRLRIFAGPNGSGKSTLAENLKEKYSIGVFVNADEIEKELRLQKFISLDHYNLESVFSHSSKLEIMEEAKKLGYKVYFYFVTTEDPDINVSRVNIRVKKNGHAVPEEKIRKRYYKSLDLMLDAIKLSWRAYLFDNSGVHYELVAQVESGKKVETHVDTIPNWFVKYLFEK